MFKELPIIECGDDYTKARNYFVLALIAYKAVAEANTAEPKTEIKFALSLDKPIHKRHRRCELV